MPIWIGKGRPDTWPLLFCTTSKEFSVLAFALLSLCVKVVRLSGNNIRNVYNDLFDLRVRNFFKIGHRIV